MGNTDSINTNSNSNNTSLQANNSSNNTSYSLLSFSSPNTIQYKITWNSGGNKVLFTGDFVEWNKYFEMNKDPSSPNTFSLTISLPQKPIQFKFIIDNEWKFSDQYPLITDNNHNINNTLDLTNATSNIINESSHTKTNTTLKDCSDDNISEAETTHSSRKTSIETNRSSNVSSKDVDVSINDGSLQQCLTKKAPRAPVYYKCPFDLMNCSKQASFGRNGYVFTHNSKSMLMNCNSSCNMAKVPVPHINLNHLMFENNIHCKNYIRCGISRRIRFKEVSVIYYKPNTGKGQQE